MTKPIQWRAMTTQLPVMTALIAAVVVGFFGPALADTVPENVEINGSSHDLESVVLDETVGLDGSVTGIITNRSDSTVRDVKVLIRHSWRWKNEYHPGENDPGRAEYVELAKPLLPGETETFRYRPVPPLSERSDGRFDTTVEVVEFDQITVNTIEVTPRNEPFHSTRRERPTTTSAEEIP
jgi:hypothetical protein